MIKAILKDERAVSPVIGVMLMVVVTIILAAVVSGFAS
ncbi:MAG: type IV pilin, partial [Methermicoccaceae archaeon]